MPKKKTYEEVKHSISLLSDGKYKLLEAKYINSKSKMKIIHLDCGNIFKMNYNNFKSGQRCPICSKIEGGNKNKVGIYEFKNEVDILTKGEYKVISDVYITSKTKIEILHKTCGTKFKTTPNNFKKTLSCPVCAYKTRAKKLKNNINEVKDKVFKDTNGEYEYVDKHYVNSQTKSKVLHNKCGNIFLVTMGNFFSGSRCPNCYSSKGETSVKTALIKNKANFTEQFCFEDLLGDSNRKLRFDFAIFENDKIKFLLEYDGRFHFEKVHKNHDLEKQIRFDNKKNFYCKINNIKLVRISYWEFNNIENVINNLMQR